MFWSTARYAIVATATLLLMGVQDTVAQMSGAANSKSNASYRIAIGQPIEDALQTLRARKIEYVEGALAMAVDEDTSYYTFTLDENHSFACLFYSKASRRVSSISVCFYPYRQMMQKVYRSWVKAKALSVHSDGSYAVDFAQPSTVEKKSRRGAAATAESETLVAENTAKPSSKTTTRVLGLDVPIVTAGDLDKHVGSLIAVAGTPSNTKIARISNVEVECPDELRGYPAIAVGILGRRVVSEQQASEMGRDGLPHDGPGVKYVLYADLQGRISEAKSVD